MFDRLAVDDGQHGLLQIRFGVRYVADVGGGDAIHAAHVLQFPIAVYDEEMRCGARVIQAPHRSRRIEQHRRRCRTPRLGQGIGRGTVDEPLFPRRGRNNAQPHDPVFLGEFLRRLHIAAGVVLARVRAIGIGPLEDHGLTVELAQVAGGAFGVLNRKVRRRATDLRFRAVRPNLGSGEGEADHAGR